MNPIKIAVIGAGQNTQRSHLPVLRNLADQNIIELVSLCDLNFTGAQNLAKTFGFTRADHDADKVINDAEIQAVYIFGTVTMHYDLAKKALHKGKHIFVEKPPVPDFKKALEITELAKQYNLIAVTGFNRRFYESLNEVIDTVKDRTRISTIEASYNKPFLNEEYLYDCSSWVSYSAIHGIDAVLAIMNNRPPKYLYSSVNIMSGSLPQNVSALFIWESGEQAVLSSNSSAGSRIEQYVIHTPARTYVCDEKQLTTISESGESTKIYNDSQKARGFYGEHYEFAQAILNKREPRNSMKNCLTIMRLVELIEQSFKGEIDWSLSHTSNQQPEAEVVSAEKAKQSILILDSMTLRGLLPIISKTYNLKYPEDLNKLTPQEKSSIVSAVTGPNGIPFNDEIIQQLPNLKIAGIVGASLKKYNPHSLIKYNIPIVNASDQYAKAVAEFTLMQALIGIKHASQAHDGLRKGIWDFTQNKSLLMSLKKLNKKLAFLKPISQIIWRYAKPKITKNKDLQPTSYARGGLNLEGRTIGLFGYGAIAKNFIRLLQPFNCKIKVYSEYLTEESAGTLNIKKASVGEILDSDIISIHRGLSDRTRGSFGRKEIFDMKKGAIFINTSRAEIVDEQALIERLKRGDIFACLDVFNKEPLPKNNPYSKLPNVFLTSHIGGATKQTFSNSAESVIDQIFDFLDGKEVNTITTPEMLNNMS